MREANWDEIFQRRRDDGATRDERLSSVLPWEDWLTFAITAVVLMSVVASVDSANWVSGMPSLYPIGFSALVTGYALSRIKRSEVLLHPAALATGASLIFLQLLVILPGGTPVARIDNLLDRMYAWWSAVTLNGISSDGLPVIVLVLVMTWLGTYVSSWAIFRWRNTWLGLTPGGVALMWNISFIPGQFSYSFVVFVFASVLLLMRMHLAKRERAWDEEGVRYPEFLSLSTLHFTFWVTTAILVLAWLIPLADRNETANDRLNKLAEPVTGRLQPLGRVFISVNAKKPITVHNLKDALALQGKISLSNRAAVTVDVKLTPDMVAYLRAQSYDQYTPQGWKINVAGDTALFAGTPIQGMGQAENAAPPRADVTVNVKVEDGNNGVLFSLGQPLQADRNADARTGASPADVSSLRPADRLANGDQYAVTGSVSIASVAQLQAAGDAYPSWVTDRYLSLPASLPDRVGTKAQEVVRGAGPTPYDQAAALERYLRTFPVDYNVPAAPAGQDAVDYFLFDAQRGYFDYYASAMAVMLRSLGIPARVASGYVISPLQRQGGTDTYALTEKNAFAWPEVYFPEIGWVEFNPTPSEAAIRRPGEPAPVPKPADSVDPNPRADAPIDLGITGAAPTDPVTARGNGGSSAWPVLLAIGLAGGALVALAAGGRLAWEWGLAGMPRSSQLWEKTLRLARLGRMPAGASETPREFARRLSGSVPGADPARLLAASYERTRFGQKVSEDGDERIEAAYAAVRGSLLRRIFRLRPREP